MKQPTLLPPDLPMLTLRLTFRANEELVLPRWKGALLRGGLGRALKRALCDPHCTDPATCLHNACPYRTIFSPDADEGRSDLHGLRDAPRPYAVIPPLDAQTHYAPGQEFSFGLVLAGRAIEYLPHVFFAFQMLGEMGIGVSRGRANLTRAESVDPLTHRTMPLLANGVLQNQWLTINGSDVLLAASHLPTYLSLRFITPMRLKHDGRIANTPEAHVLVRAALRRTSQLCAFFGSGAWEVPYTEIVQQASAVQLRERHTHWVDWTRTSGATGQHMNLGGFVGSASYANVAPNVAAVLLLGSLLHIGKSVVFGHGSYFLNEVHGLSLEATPAQSSS